jgi:L-threonylcarbamoyladenylate synthase
MTRTISIHADTDLAEVARIAAEVLLEGGVILYPTDTTYALGAHALDERAVDRVFQLKGRDYSKPIHVILRDLAQAAQHVLVDEPAAAIANEFLPGALTLVLPQKPEAAIPPLLVAGMDTLGIRIPNHLVCQLLSQTVSFPITTTSANRSGLPNTYDVETVRAQLGEDFAGIDLVLDADVSGGGVSTVIAFENGNVKLIREGSIPFSEITTYLGEREA